MATPRRPDRDRALDGLRFLAAVAVLLTHYLGAGWPYWHGSSYAAFSAVVPIAQWGWVGVNLFFLISGYAICMSSWGRSLGSFFSSRAARLFPAYLVCVPITFTVMRLLPFRGTPTFNDLVINLTMLQVPYRAPGIDGAYWTLWQELLFYLGFAFVVWRGVTYRRVVAFCLIWTVAAVLAVGTGISALQAILQRDYFMYFVAGVAMYLMRRFGANLLLWCIVGVSLLLAIYSQGPTIALYYGQATFRALAIGAAVHVLCFGLVLASALGWLNWIRWRGLTVAGALTYPLYLLHAFIGWALIDRFSGQVEPFVLLGVIVGGMLLAAYLVHRLVERPFSGRLRRSLDAAFRVGEPAAADTQDTIPGPRAGLSADGGPLGRHAAPDLPA